MIWYRKQLVLEHLRTDPHKTIGRMRHGGGGCAMAQICDVALLRDPANVTFVPGITSSWNIARGWLGLGTIDALELSQVSDTTVGWAEVIKWIDAIAADDEVDA